MRSRPFEAKEAAGLPDTSETAAIFDRDGTILDFYDMFYHFTHDLYELHRLVVPEREVIISYEFWEEVTVNQLRIGAVLVKERLNDIPRKYMQYAGVYPGIRQSLQTLRAAGVKTAVVSSWVGTAETYQFLERHQLQGLFDSVLTGDDLSADVLETPSIGREDIKTLLLKMALEEICPSAQRVLIVGDTPEDIRAGKQIDAETVAVLTGNGARLLDEIKALEPEWIIESAAQLPLILREEPRRARV